MITIFCTLSILQSTLSAHSSADRFYDARQSGNSVTTMPISCGNGSKTSPDRVLRYFSPKGA